MLRTFCLRVTESNIWLARNIQGRMSCLGGCKVFQVLAEDVEDVKDVDVAVDVAGLSVAHSHKNKCTQCHQQRQQSHSIPHNKTLRKEETGIVVIN